MSTTRAKGPFPLSNLPEELRGYYMYPRSPLSELALLAQTSKQYEAETASLRLLAAAIHAAPKPLPVKEEAKEDVTALAALTILKRHPELLFEKRGLTIRDSHDREFEASPYQIFLGAGDVWAHRQIQKEILPLIKNGEALAEAQFKEQFPNCPWPPPKDLHEEMLYDDRNKQQIEEIVKQLVTVKQLLDDDPFNENKPLDVTKQAVEALCNLFKPKPGEVIRSGLHFPLAILQEIYKTYNTLTRCWSFFSLAVIKPALDALSTVDGQCCQGGLRDLDMEKGPSRRCHPSYQHSLGQPLALRLVNDAGQRRVAALVDPYDGEALFVSSTSGWFDCFNNAGRWRGLVRAGAAVAVAAVAGLAVGKLMENKSGSLWELLCSRSQRSQHTVAMSISARGNA